MRVVIISQCTPREKVVVHGILSHFGDVVIIQPGRDKPPKDQRPRFEPNNPARKTTWLHRKSRGFFNRVHVFLLSRRTKSYDLSIRSPRIISLSMNELQSGKGAHILRDLAPDVLVTCRAPLLADEIISIPRLAAINVHYGIPPRYRGNDTLFWAHYERMYHYIGGCIHHISSGVDRGNVLAEVYPDLQPKDWELDIDLKTTKGLSTALLDVLTDIELNDNVPEGKEQEGLGRNYKHADRSVGICLRYFILLLLGKLRPEPRNGTIIFYRNDKGQYGA